MLLSRFSGVALFDPYILAIIDFVHVCKSQERIDPYILAIIDFVYNSASSKGSYPGESQDL
jgi:hypothetical protein